MSQREPRIHHLFTRHERSWRENHFVYPVISRRSHGLSLGINLNPAKGCTFDCVYCCVDRTVPPARRSVDLERVEAELAQLIDLSISGALFAQPPFDTTPPQLRRLNDVAFSGDGEPTLYTRLPDAIRLVSRLLTQRQQHQARIVLITNATEFHRPRVQESLALLDQHRGQIWAKLDAGTDEYRKRVDGGRVHLERIVHNITTAARQRPLVIQSMFLRLDGLAPTPAELDAYLARLGEIIAAGGKIELVQVYTVARPTARSHATPLEDAALDAIAQRVRNLGLHAEAFYGHANR
jgi:wyosine [tRNA(Phe)-imidazoG37] synthetase (radical SAM superfamily)